MQHFHNILFVSNGIADKTEALKQSLRLAHNNKAKLKAFIVIPELPSKMADYMKGYESFHINQLKESIQVILNQMNVGVEEISLQIEVLNDNKPADSIIRQVIRNSHDLIIKETEIKDDIAGFKAIDMELLRKSPCPVWLSRPSKPQKNIRIAVAIDPEDSASESHHLSLRLLALSSSLADIFGAELHLISCWDFPLEDSLHYAPWIDIEREEMQRNVIEARTLHFSALEKLLKQSGVAGKMHLHHERGRPDQVIPQMIENKKIDILVMGTLARTGIPGFIIGNTAENVLQKINCSLIALKPNGFISPVKAY
jgi:universal stress protein E